MALGLRPLGVGPLAGGAPPSGGAGSVAALAGQAALAALSASVAQFVASASLNALGPAGAVSSRMAFGIGGYGHRRRTSGAAANQGVATFAGHAVLSAQSAVATQGVATFVGHAILAAQSPLPDYPALPQMIPTKFILRFGVQERVSVNGRIGMRVLGNVKRDIQVYHRLTQAQRDSLMQFYNRQRGASFKFTPTEDGVQGIYAFSERGCVINPLMGGLYEGISYLVEV